MGKENVENLQHPSGALKDSGGTGILTRGLSIVVHL
jgi:hypothetical protein